MLRLLLFSFFIANSIGAYAQNSIIELPSTPNHADTIFEAYRPLQKILTDARVVLLAEPVAGISNVLEEKIRLVKYLVQEQNYNLLAFEGGFFDLAKAQQEISQGRSVQEALELSLHRQLLESPSFTPLLAWLEKNTKKLQISGYDSRMAGEYSSELLTEELREFIEKNNHKIKNIDAEYWEEIIDEMTDNFRVPDNFRLKDFVEINQELLETIRKIKKSTSVNAFEADFWEQVLLNVETSAKYYKEIRPASTQSDASHFSKIFNIRNAQMADNIQYLLRTNPEAKIICWGEASNLANHLDSLQSTDLVNFKPMGGLLKEKLGDNLVYSMAFTVADGSYGNTNNPQTIATPDSCLEKLFADKGFHRAIIPINDAGFTEKNTAVALNLQPITGKWHHVFDSFIFLKTSLPTPKQENIQLHTTGTLDKTFASTQSKNNKRDYQTIAGKIIETKTGIPIPYVSIYIPNTNIGTATNEAGEFLMRLPMKYQHDTLQISVLSFETQRHSVFGLLHRPMNIIEIQPQAVVLNEVIVRGKPLSAKEVIRKVIDKIPNNYIQESYTSEYLLRQQIKSPFSGKSYVLESVVRKHDQDGYQNRRMFTGKSEGFTIYRQSRIGVLDTNTGKATYFMPDSIGVYGNTKYQDFVNFRHNCFLRPLRMGRYKFTWADTVMINNQSVYVIDFECRRPTRRSTLQEASRYFRGKIFINVADFGILKVLSYNLIIPEKIKGYELLPGYSQERQWYEEREVNYKKIGQYYYLNYALYQNNFNYDFIETIFNDLKNDTETISSLKAKPSKRYDSNLWLRYEGIPKIRIHF